MSTLKFKGAFANQNDDILEIIDNLYIILNGYSIMYKCLNSYSFEAQKQIFTYYEEKKAYISSKYDYSDGNKMFFHNDSSKIQTKKFSVQTKIIPTKSFKKKENEFIKIDISSLCDDEWIEIISYFSLNEIFTVISFVSKKFYDLGAQVIQKSQISRYMNEYILDKQVFYIIKSIPDLESINLASCESLTSDCLKYIVLKKYSLKSVNFSFNRLFNDKNLPVFFSQCLNLEVVILDHLEINSRTVESICNLTKLRDFRCFRSDITDIDLIALVKSCKNLEILDIGGSKISSKYLYQITKNLKKLKELYIDDHENFSSKDFIEFLKNENQLVYLSMNETIISSEIIIEISKSCPSLKNLEIKYCKRDKSDNIKEALQKYLFKVKVIFK